MYIENLFAYCRGWIILYYRQLAIL